MILSLFSFLENSLCTNNLGLGLLLQLFTNGAFLTSVNFYLSFKLVAFLMKM